MAKSVLLIGLGRFGYHMAERMQELKDEVLGVDIDEEAAKKYPPTFRENFWLKCRLPDGTCVRA